VAREFHRRIQLPSDVDPAKLSSTLSTDGILTVEAPVPPRYHAVVGPHNHGAGGGGGRPPASVEARASPVRLEPTAAAGRSRSPFHDVGGRRSPFACGVTAAAMDVDERRSPFGILQAAAPGNGGVRSSPVMFGSLAPPVGAVAVPPAAHVDVPVIATDPATGRRRLELVLELGRPYTADDVVVRVDGRRLTVEARHEARDQHGRVTTSSTQKQFDVDDQLDEKSVRATLRDDGRMVITGNIKH